LGRLFRADGQQNEKRNLLVFIHPTIVDTDQSIQSLSQQRYNQLYSLQLAMDKDGSFAKLPENVNDVYQQRIPVSPSKPKPPTTFQKLPSGGATPVNSGTVTTPIAIESNKK
jgi:general secretion pathway protein D